MPLQESGEMYLETILLLSKTLPIVRSLDVAEYMGFSKPSISRAVGLLKNGGYIDITTVLKKSYSSTNTWLRKAHIFRNI